jgi:hypothetical protein
MQSDKVITMGFEEFLHVTGDPDADLFSDDTPLECGIENPEVCESCT